MSVPSSDRDLDRLLAGGKPAAPEADALWQRVAGTLGERGDLAATPGWRRWLPRLSWVALPAAAAAAVLIFVQPAADVDDLRAAV